MTAVAAGEIPQVVGQHIDAWNRLKAATPTYVLEYAQFCEEHKGLWAEAGLPISDSSAGFGGTWGVPGLPATSSKVGRNEPCPCGSGRKFKHCCGK